MASYQEEEDPFEEDIVFDQAGLLNSSTKMKSAIRRVSSGKCVLFAKTLGLCGAFFGLGLCIAIPGPTFLSPITDVKADSSPISNLYAARSSGYLMGSVIGGMLFDRFNRLFLLFISLLVTSVFITVTPWCRVLWLLEACMVILGISMGFLDTGGNVLCLDLWGRNSGPFMQALHFSFGLGAFVAPLLASASIGMVPVISVNNSVSATMSPVLMSTVPHDHIRIQRFAQDSNLTYFSGKIENFENDYSENSSSTDASPVDSSEVYSKTNLEVKFSDKFSSMRTAVHVEETSTSTTTTQKTPKRKPSVTVVHEQSDINWDKVPMRSPPAKDLIALTTTPTTTTLTATTESTNSAFTSSVTSYTAVTFPGSTTSLTFESNSSPSNPVNAESSTEIPNPSESYQITETSGLATTNLFSTDQTALKPSETSKSDTDLSVHNKEENDSSTVGSTLFSANENFSLLYKSRGVSKDGSNLEAAAYTAVTDSETLHAKDMKNGQPHIPLEATMSTTLISQTIQPILQHLPESTHPTKENSADNKQYYIEDTHESVEYSNKDSPPDTPVSSTGRHYNGSSVDGKQAEHTPATVASTTTTTTVHATTKHIHHFKPGTYDNDTEDINTIFDILGNRIEKYGFSKIQFTYLIVGLFVFVISLIFLGFLCHNPRDPKSKQEEGQMSKKISNKLLYGSLVSLMSVFFMLCAGLEVAYGQLVLAFAVHSDLQLSQSTGSMIAVTFWGSFSAMRFASIFFASGFTPLTMLILNFVFCTVGTVLLSTLANFVETALWIGTAFTGIGLASMFPTGILWIERYIRVSNKIAAVFVIGVSVGEMACPVILYRLMSMNTTLLMYAALVINVTCIMLFLVLRWLVFQHGEKYSVVTNNGYQLASQNDEEEDMIDMSPSSSAIGLKRHSFSSEHRALLNGNIHRGP